jgi:hypothetical protein
MKPETVAWLARLRAQAVPGTDLVFVRGPLGSISLYPHEIVGKSDDELLAFVTARLTDTQQDTRTPQ